MLKYVVIGGVNRAGKSIIRNIQRAKEQGSEMV